MALNWDKLTKLQRDNPKPKFALNLVGKQLKKRPNDSYLLAWRADLLLRSGDEADLAPKLLGQVYQHRPPITDVSLLSYIYGIQLQVNAREPNHPGRHSGGADIIGAWTNAAKSLSLRSARVDLWSELFLVAMREGCWGDVTTAITNTWQDGLKSKNVYFALIFAGQIASEVMKKSQQDSQSRLSAQLAGKRMKKAFEDAQKPTELVRVQDIRDLRFMAQIYSRQSKVEELTGLWQEPPAPLEKVLQTNSTDIQLLQIDMLRKNADWDKLATSCLHSLEQILEETSTAEAEKVLERMSVVSWRVFSSLFEALDRAAPGKHMTERLKAFLSRCEEREISFDGRSCQLTRMSITSFLSEPLLSMCQSYWLAQRHVPGCFHDLRRFVERLSRLNQAKFHKFITETTRDLITEPLSLQEKALREWLQVEVNVLKFDYLMTLSIPDETDYDVVDAFVINALRLYKIGMQLNSECRYESGCLAIMAILVAHADIINRERTEFGNVKKRDINTRLQLQAAMLAHHLTRGEAGNQNRPLLLLTVRLHVMLGFVSIAFEQYGRARIKEMLHDNVSYILLTRISQLHPFDSPGFKVSPDDELARVVGTIQRMESKVDNFLYADIQDFQYDQAFELLEFKQKLKCSMTKHLCVVERRRIAWLKGDVPDERLELNIDDFSDITDNRDFSILPNFEKAGKSPLVYLMSDPNEPFGLPRGPWLRLWHAMQEDAHRLLEGGEEKKQDQFAVDMLLDDQFAESEELWDDIDAERSVSVAWDHAECLLAACERRDFRHESTLIRKHVDGLRLELDGHYSFLAHQRDFYRDQKALIADGTGKLADVHLATHEATLTTLFGHLELLQLCYRLCDHLAQLRARAAGVALRVTVKDADLDGLRTVIQDSTTLVRELATGWIDVLKMHGRHIIKAQVRWGPTGAALATLISDDDLEAYAGAYVASSVDAMEGILKVKVGKK